MNIAMRLRTVAAGISVTLLAACANTAPAPVVESSAGRVEPALGRQAVVPAEPAGSTYTVRKGDTLYGIALDHGLDYKDIVAWNNLENPNRILIDQVLKMAPPGVAVAASAADGVITRPVAAPAAIEVRPIRSGGEPVGTASGGSDGLKREPKGGKQAYSVEALERLRKAEGIRVVEPLASAPGMPVVPVSPVALPGASSPSPAPAAPMPVPVNSTAVDWMWPLTGSLLAPFVDGNNKGIDIAGKIGDPVSAAAGGKVVYAGSGLRGYGKLLIVRHSPDYLSAYAHASQLLVKEGQVVTRGQKIAEVGDTDAERPKLHFEVRFQGKPVDPQKHLPPR